MVEGPPRGSCGQMAGGIAGERGRVVLAAVAWPATSVKLGARFGSSPRRRDPMPVTVNRGKNPAIMEELLKGASSTAFLKFSLPRTAADTSNGDKPQPEVPASVSRPDNGT